MSATAEHTARRAAPRPHDESAARERMFVQYQPLARKLARRYVQTSVPIEDLQQIAYIGLLLSIDRFDHSRGRPFASFAIPTILGEVRRYLRDHSRPVHVTRRAQERSAAVRAAEAKMIEQTGRAPTAQQVAQYLEIDPDDVVDGLLAHAAYDTTSFDQPVARDSESGTLAEQLGEDDAGYDLVDVRAAIRTGLDALTERDRDVLRMRFSEEMTQTRIAEALGCSQMQISRIEAKALQTMRRHAGASLG